mgnify:CR=1 FL=1
MTSRRLDAELVRLGLARSRAQARELVVAGAVHVDGRPVTRAAHPVPDGAAVALSRYPEPWVSRAAGKLLHALDRWGPGSEHEGRTLDPTGLRCLDVGASTGGFTQLLLQRGASHVTALDVGHGQLVPALAADPRVLNLPGTNIRQVRPGDLGPLFDLVVADLSFISLLVTLAPMARLTAPGGDLVVLIKPQFEVGRERLGHGGVVRSGAEHRRVVRSVAEHAGSLGLRLLGLTPSPVTGAEGNREFLLWVAPPPTEAAAPLDDMLELLDREEAQ